jgi:hypothetical protein
MTSSIHRLVFFCYISLFLVSTSTIHAATIKGHVIDSDTHDFVQGTILSLKGTKFVAVAGSKGEFVFNNIPKGTYFINARMLGYKFTVKDEINLKANDDVVNYEVYLRPDSRDLSNVEVKGAKNKETDAMARLDEKLASNVINIISAKTIETLPDQNVADVMQRVSGVSMVKNNTGNNTDVIVRGMSPRYNSVLINGTSAPSTSGSDRSVPLDIIPADLVGRVSVTKALTPDQEGSGIGGTVNVEMKDAPEKPFFNINVATGYNQFFFDNKLSTFDYSNLQSYLKDPTETHLNTNPNWDYQADLSDFSRAHLIIKQIQAPLDLNGAIAWGRRFFNNKLGVWVQGSYATINKGSYSNFTPYSIDNSNEVNLTQWNNRYYYTQGTRIGSNVRLDYQLDKNNKISLYNSYFQLTEERVRHEADTTSDINKGRLQFQDVTNTDISTLVSTSLQGHHQVLNNLEVDWSLVYSLATNQSPDLVTINTIQIIHPLQPVYLNYTSCITREWQHNTDDDKTAYLNVKYRTKLFGHSFEFKAGGMARAKFRNNYANEFTFDAPINNPGNPDMNTVVVTQNRNAQQRSGNPLNNPGNYKATENIEAVYIQFKTNFGKLQILGGVREEFTYQTNYHSETQNVLVPFTAHHFSYFDALPSLHFNYQITDKQNFRLSAYQGISRPNYTELVDFHAAAVNGGSTGNPNLQHCVGTSLDARYEYYPDKEEVITAGIFYKYLPNPILDLYSLGSNNNTIVNLGTPSKCYGFELVGTKYFGNFGGSINYTFTHSEMTRVGKILYYTDANGVTQITGGNTVGIPEIIPLAGQSPHLINLAANYRDLKNGFKIQAVYTMQGRNLRNISNFYGQDTYQKTFHDLGATLEKTLFKKLFLYGKVSNLLNSKLEFETNSGTKVQEISTSLSFILGLKYSL